MSLAAGLRRSFTALALSALLAPTLVVSSSAADALPGANERGAPRWHDLNVGPVSETVPSLLRTPDGTLVVAYTLADQSVVTSRISRSGRLVGHGVVAGGWAATNSTPAVTRAADGRLRVFFGGQRTAVPGDPWARGFTHSSVSADGGVTWAVEPTVAGNSPTGYRSTGMGAVAMADGTSVVAWADGSDIRWAATPMPPSAGDADTSPFFTLAGDAVAREVRVVRSGDEAWIGWAQAGSTAETNGMFARRIHPSLGPILKSPLPQGQGSEIMYGASALTVRPQGSVVSATCVGAAQCTDLAVWDVGTGKLLPVPTTGDAIDLAISSTPDGRIWAAWAENNRVHVARTNRSATRFGTVQELDWDGNTHGLAIDAAGGQGAGNADVLLNLTSSIKHAQVKPALTVRVNPKRVRARGASRPVRVTVTDAGDALRGAKVRGFGSVCTTNARGTCRLVVRNPLVKPVVRVRAKGYESAQIKLKRRR